MLSELLKVIEVATELLCGGGNSESLATKAKSAIEHINLGTALDSVLPVLSNILDKTSSGTICGTEVGELLTATRNEIVNTINSK